MTEEAGEAAAAIAQAQPRVRVDWRTGQPMLERDDAFWQAHERRRLEQGLSIPRYCAANGLALSTYRHRVEGRQRLNAKAKNNAQMSSALPGSQTAAATPLAAFVAVSMPGATPAAALEIELQGMTLRLTGAAAERVLASVIRRLG